MKPVARSMLVGLAGAAIAFVMLYWWFAPRVGRVAQVDYKTAGNPEPKILAAEAAAIERRERLVEETIWKREMEAQAKGRIVEDLWDGLKGATNRWDFLLKTGLAEWSERFEKWRGEGWEIDVVEFRHRWFDGARSGFYFAAGVTNRFNANRAIAEGELKVEWGEPGIKAVDASGVAVKEGRAGFSLWLESTMERGVNDGAMEPLMVLDFDGDGALEVAAGGGNRIWQFRNGEWRGGGGWLKGRGVVCAVAGDFNGDRALDLLAVRQRELTLFAGPWRSGVAWEGKKVSEIAFAGAQVLTCGDADGDGDLDVFLGAYRGPFKEGRMPTPFYDANNSDPSFLLRNDGRGNFSDGTDAAGLTKRNRHVYAASLIDLDGDKNLDLVVTSDFHGLDVWRGDGKGRFEEVTANWTPERWGFGMAHLFEDFNNDGRVDILMIGMTSPTVSRLEHAGLQRPDSRFDPGMRKEMAYGNRLLIGQGAGVFALADLSASIRDAGWAWGAAAADFNGDGFADVYVCNGMETHRSVRDYESELWLHDMFVGSAEADAGREYYFKVKGGRMRGADGLSFGGNERNRLFMNEGGTRFAEMGYLLGVGLAEDCRSVVAEDFDGDGRMDLALTTFESAPRISNRLRIYRNGLEQKASAKRERVIVTGDGYNSQRSSR